MTFPTFSSSSLQSFGFDALGRGRRRRARGDKRTSVPDRRVRAMRAKTVEATRRARDENSKIARFEGLARVSSQGRRFSRAARAYSNQGHSFVSALAREIHQRSQLRFDVEKVFVGEDDGVVGSFVDRVDIVDHRFHPIFMSMYCTLKYSCRCPLKCSHSSRWR